MNKSTAGKCEGNRENEQVDYESNKQENVKEREIMKTWIIKMINEKI